MLARIREAVRKAGAQAPRDEVFPSDGAPVLVLREGKVVPAVMGWGFPGMQAGRNVINARAETAEERAMFRDGVAARRCVVPATDVYQHCGFGDYSNFYRAFKAEYGISPKDFSGTAQTNGSGSK